MQAIGTSHWKYIFQNLNHVFYHIKAIRNLRSAVNVQNDIINPFSTNVALPYPLKTSEYPRFSNVLRGYRSGTLAENGLKKMS